ncbi:5'-deoxynucleotidase [Acutalibacter sp. 1XD8-33]|uniref:5'-deoxynucleotidase n=1 Tax=Acutalibacter sp. 1XD8-33 TaxID=2320081 RepID=UPI000EA02304|nr:5'-deoxynucleotidase [Acutalibacter sp. 1XD8-33]RKJ41458.1 5'-deoxynucleotidase [Acutalibacter sp. 1XD8-33]
MYPFFAMLSRMKYINRWGLMRNTREENLCEHSLEVAIVAHALAVLGNKRFGKTYDPQRAAALALLHDASEIITGDMPTPVKYHSEEIRKAYGEVEDMAVEHLVSMLPEDLRPEYRALMTMSAPGDQELTPLVKAADRISAVIKCVEERQSGNRDFSKAEQTILKSIRDMGLPEANAFLREFMPGYGLTIEEQDYTRQAGLKFGESSQLVFSKVLNK